MGGDQGGRERVEGRMENREIGEMYVRKGTGVTHLNKRNPLRPRLDMPFELFDDFAEDCDRDGRDGIGEG